MFRDPRNREPVINDDFEDDLGGGGGGVPILPPPDDDPPVVDTTPPVISNLKITPSTINLSSSNPSETVTITCTVTDFESIVTNVHLNGLGASNISYFNYTWNKTYYYSNYSAGTHSENLTVYATNSETLSSTSSISLTVNAASQIVKDITPPTINSFTVDNNSVTLNNSQTSVTVTFTANIVDDTSVNIYTVSNATFSSKSGNNYYFTKTFSFNNYSFGDTTDTFTLVAADDAGNLSTKSLNITITKNDTQAPVITSFTVSDSTVSLSTNSQSQSVTFNATVSDNVGISSVNLPGASLTFTYSNTYVFTKTYYYSQYSFGNSTDTRTLTVTDNAGNSVSNNIQVSISKTDTESPVVSSFSANDTSVTLNTSNTQSQLVTFTATVTDNLSVNSVSLPNTLLFLHLVIHIHFQNYSNKTNSHLVIQFKHIH